MGFILGIDAGGTATVAVAYDTKSGQSLGRCESGFGNVVVDYERALEHIRQAAMGAAQGLGTPDFVLVGAAGVMTGGLNHRLAQDLSSRLHCPVTAETDARLALEGALEGGDGVLLISGTGSAAQGRKGEKLLLIGGWGNLVGDEGSAYGLARSAIQKMIADADEDLPERPLSVAVRGVYGAANAREVVRFISGHVKSDMAAAAPVITELAELGDADARALVTQAGENLSRFVAIAAQRLELPKGFPLAMQGAVLRKSAIMRQSLSDALQRRGVDCILLPMTRELTRGAWYYYQNLNR